MKDRVHLLIWCVAVGLLAFSLLEVWNKRNSPLYQRLETQWREDVDQLESSRRLPDAWFSVRNLEIIGGTPETKDWLSRIKVPLKTRADGRFSLEVLVVAWEEDGKRGALIQYNLADLKTKNNVWELGRTLILSRPPAENGWFETVKEVLQ